LSRTLTKKSSLLEQSIAQKTKDVKGQNEIYFQGVDSAQFEKEGAEFAANVERAQRGEIGSGSDITIGETSAILR